MQDKITLAYLKMKKNAAKSKRRGQLRSTMGK
jgi:hypothetical protein